MPATALSNELGNWKYKKVMKPLPFRMAASKGHFKTPASNKNADILVKPGKHSTYN